MLVWCERNSQFRVFGEDQAVFHDQLAVTGLLEMFTERIDKISF